MKENTSELLESITDYNYSSESVEKITGWLCGICRKKNIQRGDIFISYCRHKSYSGRMQDTTLICIVNHLPQGPVVSISKRPEDITLEDVLGCYKLINYCKPEGKGSERLN